ncbi:MAG: response regulator transcription factor [Flavobacteriales bacterium]|nr:response regulator transcription factor [Flavobacteriales bacterium]MCX7650791.1 response regulator transcription factor [Flavobacteriales bacterium]MDW8431575.1 response regulator transcription factor [Flavobacteriales bacterium]
MNLRDNAPFSILLAEDDSNLALITQDLLQDQGYEVTLASDGAEATRWMHEKDFDLYILDVMMPEKDGFTLAAELRKLKPLAPIIFVTARDMTEDKVRGLRLGADDYVTKPYEPEELILRIANIRKRIQPPDKEVLKNQDPDVVEIGHFKLVFSVLELHYKGQLHKKLTAKEARILRYLALRAGQTIERETLMNAVWGKSDYFIGRSLDVFITKLRKYLAEDPRVRITNIHGVGFRLEVGGMA